MIKVKMALTAENEAAINISKDRLAKDQDEQLQKKLELEVQTCPFIEHTCAYVLLALMHCFLSVRLSVRPSLHQNSDLKIIHNNSLSIAHGLQ